MPTAAFSEYLTIGSVIIGTRASWCGNLQVLRNSERRGENRTIPGVDGRNQYRRLRDEVPVQLELVIAHDYDSDGAALSDLAAGQQDNIAELETIAADDPATTTGAQTVVWHRKDGTEWSADCQIGPLRLGEEWDDTTRATLNVIVPGEGWTETGS